MFFARIAVVTIIIIIIIIILLITQLTKRNHELNVRKLINVFKK